MTPTSPTQTPSPLADGIAPAVRHLLPEGLCRGYGVLPYAERGGRVLVATHDPSDAVVEHVLAERLGRPVLLVGHARAEVLAALETVFSAGRAAGATEETRAERERRLRLRQMLLRSGLVDEPALARADAAREVTGDPFEEVLRAEGVVGEDVLVAALSELHGLQRVSLAGSVPPRSLVRLLSVDTAARLRALPVAESAGAVVVAAARPLPPEQVRGLEREIGRPVRLVLCDGEEIEHLLVQSRALDLADRARVGRATAPPRHSSRGVVSAGQRLALAVLLAAVVLALLLDPGLTMTALAVVLMLGALAVGAHRAVRAVRALRPVVPLALDRTPADELPGYSVLVPVRGTPAVLAEQLPGLVASIEALDYPRSRVEVLLLCEEHDDPAVAAVRELSLPPHARLVVVPDSHPLTAAKACNVGLQLARGELVVSFEVGDRPEPDQLRQAAAAFARNPALACVQARLQHDTATPGAGLTSRWAAGELATRSGLWIPAAAAAGGVVSLADSSHHLRAEVLRDLDGWEPYTHTPGPDLGVRLRRAGHRVGVVEAATWSHAPRGLRALWHRRGRAHRGLLVTALVHGRRPLRLARDLGLRSSLALALAGLTGLGLMLVPVLAVGAAGWLLVRDAVPAAHAGAVDLLGVTSLVVVVASALVSAYLALAGSLRLGRHDLAASSLLSPLTWLVLTPTSLLAAGRLVATPYADETPGTLEASR